MSQYQGLTVSLLVIFCLAACQAHVPFLQGTEWAGEPLQATHVVVQEPGSAISTPLPVNTASATFEPTATLHVQIPSPQGSLPTTIPYVELMKTHLLYYVTDPVETEGGACKYYKLPFLVFPHLPRTGDYRTDISTALAILFSMKETTINGYNNFLSASDLAVSELSKSGHTLHVYLYGSLYIHGRDRYCDDWQARDQIVMTVEQFSEVLAGNGMKDIVYHMDDELLDDLLLHDLSLNTNP